ncbi:hypothetical protein ACIO93_43225 [Streptomyces sp. NPDC087903]|uniref:hypothetical protein n=1 Tax=Streptomyces sp. NPDC087903 TaxID=3365819 RepID=UPI0038293472
MPQPITRTLDWLRRQPRTTRIVIVVGICVGLPLIGFGVWLDSIDWWPRHGYLLNLFSGLTGACFGVPFALVGLDYLTRSQAEFRETERARTRAAAEVASFVATLLEVFNGRGLDDVATRAQDLSNRIENLRFMRLDDPARGDAVRAFLAAFDELIPERHGRPRDRFKSFTRYSNEAGELRLWRTGVKTQWRRLDEGARGQMADAWIDKPTETAGHQAAEQLLMEGRNPWRQVSDPERAGVAVMRHFLADLKALCEAAKAMEAHTR